MNIDSLSTLEILRVINNEDKKVAYAIENQLDNIARAVDIIVEKLQSGGRLIYLGAGTSGRIGILDASECPPTYGTPPGLVQALIAGGKQAIENAVEGAEDDGQGGVKDLQALDFTKDDVLVGITASGSTPYVLGAIEYGNEIGAKTIGISNNPGSKLSEISHVSICPDTGPEVITGSTRMKAGTSQKLVLNMISTGAMIKSGKVYKNLMVDVQATNDKLITRSKNIVMEATGASLDQAESALKESDYNCKLAILMILSNLDLQASKKLLEDNNGYISKALDK